MSLDGLPVIDAVHALRSAAEARDAQTLAGASALLRRRLLERPEAAAAADPGNGDALWYEQAFLSAEIEAVEEAEKAMAAGELDAATSLARTLARIEGVIELRELRAPGSTGAAAPPVVGQSAGAGAPPPGQAGGSRGATRVLGSEEVGAILRRNNWGVLATSAGDVPYGVPIIYGWDGAHLYFVSGPGRKSENLEANPRVTFTIAEVEEGGARWRSVILHGEARVLTDVVGRLKALGALRRQRPGTRRRSARDAARLARARFIRLEAAEITGREMG